ncbi:MAG TPA: porin family protein [Flavobacteriaceae bacterium]|nr:porin family protein [Flavobacteriaceae bacterium]
MKRYFLYFLLATISYSASAQVDPNYKDLNYLEDQFYLSLSYNIVRDLPEDASQNGFSGGVHLGFLRDFPINEQRNIAIAAGLGYGFDVLVHNIVAEEQNNNYSFSIAEDYDLNKWTFHSLELPLEFRWRTSTPTKYKFLRVYSGIKFSYLFATKTDYELESVNLKYKNPSFFNKFQYGIILSAGYHNWNLYMYYSLSPLLDNSEIDGKPLELREFNVGLKFYIM